MGGRRTRVACGGSGTEMYRGDSGGMRDEEEEEDWGGWGWEAEEVVLKLRLLRRVVVVQLAVLDGVQAEVRRLARPPSDGRGIGGGILTGAKP